MSERDYMAEYKKALDDFQKKHNTLLRVQDGKHYKKRGVSAASCELYDHNGNPLDDPASIDFEELNRLYQYAYPRANPYSGIFDARLNTITNLDLQ